MTDIDFDELDKAVNALSLSQPQEPAGPAPFEVPSTLSVSDPTPVATIAPVDVPVTPPSTPVISAPAPVAAAPAVAPTPPPVAPDLPPFTPAPSAAAVHPTPTPPQVTRGRFLDMVHPSNDMRPAQASRPAPAFQAAITPTAPVAPVVVPAPVVETPAPSVVSAPTPVTAVPEPDFAPVTEPTPVFTTTPQPVAEPAFVPEPTPAAPVQVAEVPKTTIDPTTVTDDFFSQQTTTPTDEPDGPSPFLTDAKVEKRPLGAFTGAAPVPEAAPVLTGFGSGTISGQSTPPVAVPGTPLSPGSGLGGLNTGVPATAPASAGVAGSVPIPPKQPKAKHGHKGWLLAVVFAAVVIIGAAVGVTLYLVVFH